MEHISADTIEDEASGESFYLVRVKTDVAELRDKQGEPLPVIPGMTAAVDILTGKRTVLQYILKPLPEGPVSARCAKAEAILL